MVSCVSFWMLQVKNPAQFQKMGAYHILAGRLVQCEFVETKSYSRR